MAERSCVVGVAAPPIDLLSGATVVGVDDVVDHRPDGKIRPATCKEILDRLGNGLTSLPSKPS